MQTNKCEASGGSHPKMRAHPYSIMFDTGVKTTQELNYSKVSSFILKIGVRMVGVSILLNSFNPLRRCIELDEVFTFLYERLKI